MSLRLPPHLPAVLTTAAAVALATAVGSVTVWRGRRGVEPGAPEGAGGTARAAATRREDRHGPVGADAVAPGRQAVTGCAEPVASAPAGPGRTGAPAPGSAPRAWAELLRLPALFTVPGDALAGAATTGARHGRGTLLAVGASVCLYEAGMALNDWADRAEDAVDRPHRPLPSGRIRPTAALVAAGALTAAGLGLAAAAGRPALTVTAALAATVWAYDLHLKHTPAGPAAMAAARGLDLLLGAAATRRPVRRALPSAALLGTHTLAVTAVSRHEAQGGSTAVPLGALAITGALALTVLGGRAGVRRERGPGPALTALPAGRRAAAAPGLPGPTRSAAPAPRSGVPDARGLPGRATAATPGAPLTVALRIARPADALCALLAVSYAGTAAQPLLHAALNPSPELTQRAVGGGIRATIPLQAALIARSGPGGAALLTAALAPAARAFARKVSVT